MSEENVEVVRRAYEAYSRRQNEERERRDSNPRPPA
jgi:hypothetical protein